MNRGAPTNGETTADWVHEAVGRTLAEGTAELDLHSRVGAPDGEVSAADTAGSGWIDFSRRRAWYSGNTPAFAFAPSAPVENYWEAETQYVRFGPDEPWDTLPLIDISEAHTPYNSPFWLLDALAACESDAVIVGHGTVCGVSTTRVRTILDLTTAMRRNPRRLDVPRKRATRIAAETWIDEQGRLRRLSSTWDIKQTWKPRRLVTPYWMTTDFPRFGIPVDTPAPPVTPVERRGDA